MSTLDTRIRLSIQKNPHAPDYQIAKNLKTQVPEVRRVRDSMHDTVVEVSLLDEDGIDLRGLKVLQRKPADSASSFIKKLPQGRGFELHVLSARWGIAEDTIKRHAKDLNCLRFVQVNDEWIPMVINPTTAERLPS